MYSVNGMDSLFGSSYNPYSSAMQGYGVWLIIAGVLAVLGGLILYFTFLKKENEGKYTGFKGWMYDFLGFKKLLIEGLLKVTYLVAAIYITLSAFGLIGANFLGFILMLVFGNVGLRLVYEFCLIAIINCRNTTEINKKMTAMQKQDTKEE